MTVGFAAICDADADVYFPKIVFCADRAVTAGVEYESGQSKIKKLTNYCYVMQSTTDSRLSDMILENVKTKLSVINNHVSITEIVQMIKQECIDFKQVIIEHEVLSKYNHLIGNLKAAPEHIVKEALEEVRKYEYQLGCEFLVVGFDSSRTPHIFTVDQEGRVLSYDSVGFGHIGSGGGLAFLEMTKYQYSTTVGMSHAIARVYFAKKTAERAEGVGPSTDFLVLMPEWEQQNDGKDEYILADIANTEIVKILDGTLQRLHKYESKQLDMISQSIYNIVSGNAKVQEEPEKVEK